jgi:hypothetical protein
LQDGVGAGLETGLGAAAVVVGLWVSAQAPSRRKGSITITPSFIITVGAGIVLRTVFLMSQRSFCGAEEADEQLIQLCFSCIPMWPKEAHEHPSRSKEHYNQVSGHCLIGQIFGGVGSLASLA